jgi:hypothetical protein
MPLGRYVWRAGLSLVLLWGILSHPAYIGATHSDQPGHCCDLCHLRHVPPLQAQPAFRLPGLVAANCELAPNDAPAPGEPLLVASSSRSPPAP